VEEDDIDYPATMTWIDNIGVIPDPDTYAAQLLFLLMCSKKVKALKFVFAGRFCQ